MAIGARLPDLISQWEAGVKAGDRLVSINGKKDFCGGSSDAVREMLVPPLMLVFTGFVGKLHAEVRCTIPFFFKGFVVG